MKAPSYSTVLEVADDAVEVLRYGNEQVKWLAALLKAIQLDAQYNQSSLSAELINLGQYLSNDCSEYLSEQSAQLQTQLGTEAKANAASEVSQ